MSATHRQAILLPHTHTLSLSPHTHALTLLTHDNFVLSHVSLQHRIGPLLGISRSLHAAVSAWVYFRQAVRTQSPVLLADTKGRLHKLAQLAAATTATSSTNSAGAAAAPGSSGTANGSSGGCVLDDAAFARGVGDAVVTWIVQHLSDYHSR